MGNCFLFELRTCKPLCILRLRRVCRAQGISSKVLESPSLLPDVEVSEVEVIAVRGEGRLWLWQALRRIGRVTILPPPHTHTESILWSSASPLHSFLFTRFTSLCLCFAFASLQEYPRPSRLPPLASTKSTATVSKMQPLLSNFASSPSTCASPLSASTA